MRRSVSTRAIETAAGPDLDHVDDRNAHRDAAALGEAISAGDLGAAGLLRGVKSSIKVITAVSATHVE